MSNIITKALFDLLTNIPGAGEVLGFHFTGLHGGQEEGHFTAFSEARVKTENNPKPTA